MPALGTVIATTDSPTLDKIDFIIDRTAFIERGQFVSIKKEASTILGVISSIRKFNAYYEALDPSLGEIATRDYNAIFPTEEWESTIAEIKPLGELDRENQKVSRVKFPVSPGSQVYNADARVVAQFLGLDEKGIHLGHLYSNDVKIQINLSRLLRKHLGILAISGAGKSYAATVLLEELYRAGNLGVFVIDPHGEYSQVLPELDKTKSSQIEVVQASFISIGVPELTAWDLAEFIPEMSVVHTRVLDNIISAIKKGKEIYGLPDIIQVITSSEAINARTKDALVGWLFSLQRTYLFSTETNPIIEIEPGKITILDLSEIQNIRSRSIIVHHFLKRLYWRRTRNEIPPTVFIIEEAHQFCPEGRRSISKRIIETIAREGRKFYASLCLISQRPVNLSVTALSQCNTNLILRIRNPYDLDFIGRTSEGIDRAALRMLPDLEIGEALIVGEAVNYPTFFKVRTRDFKTKTPTLNLQEYAASWRSNNSL